MLLPVLWVTGSTAAQSTQAVRISLGGGPSITDQASGTLPSPGIGSFVRVTIRDNRPVSAFGDIWLLTQGHTTVETAPCPSSVLCGGGSSAGNTTLVVLAPALQAGERYERVTLFYRLGPSVDWFAERSIGTRAVTLGARAGLALLTSRTGNGLLLSMDYFRAFRGTDRPRWFLPITIGFQF